MKIKFIFFLKQLWTILELLNRLVKEETPLIDVSVDVFLNDVYDHTVQIIDTIESLRDLMTVLLYIYLSTASNKMNEVINVLTIIATIFIPLTFIIGIYGMNHEFMPELKFPYAYPILWTLIVLISVALVV